MKVVFALLTLIFNGFVVFAGVDAGNLLKAADQIRNPSENYKMQVEVVTPDLTSELEVYLKGSDKTMVITKAPAKDKGRNMLMLGRDFYAYIPNLKRNLKVSLAQKMTSQVANGDISRTRWYGDYDAKIEKKDDLTTQLFLEGRKKNLTYQKMRLWIETSTNKPLHAEYLSLDGKSILKRARFEDYKTILGKERPTQIVIEDVDRKVSTVRIKDMQPASTPDSFFTKKNLKTLR